MISHGDELGRTQLGNNNPYCQDNELTWMHWDLTKEQRALLDFTSLLVHFRRSQPVLRRRKYADGRNIRGGGVKDIVWLSPEGREMTDEMWNAEFVRCLGVVLAGNAMEEINEIGEPVIGDTLLILLNADREKVPFTLPPTSAGEYQWLRVLDTMVARPARRIYRGATRYPLQGRSSVVFKMTTVVRDRRRSATSQQFEPVHVEPAPAKV
jgi:glycogen operon protein